MGFPRGFGRAMRALSSMMAALVAASCATTVTDANRLTPTGGRLTDGAVAQDLRLLDGWLARAEAVHDSTRAYDAALARGWLQMARSQYLHDDRTGLPEAALAEGMRHVQAIETGRTITSNFDVAGTERVRPDLWQLVSELRARPGAACAAPLLGQLEIALVWAGNEERTCGPGDPRPHQRAAERLAELARSAVASCQSEIPEPVRQPAPASIRDTVVILVPPTRARPVLPTRPDPIPEPVPERLVVPNVIHFGFDSDTIGASSQAVLEEVAAVLNRHPSVTVSLFGHTDSRGSREYNLALSSRRASAVRRQLAQLGISPARLTIVAEGEADLYQRDESEQAHAHNRRVEIFFFTGSGVQIMTVRQTDDLNIR